MIFEFFIPIILFWTPPTLNTDGSDLRDLAGYKIYQSLTQGGPYVEVANVTNPAVSTYALDLPANTYYFVSTAYNAADVESQYSNEAMKVAASTPAPPADLIVTGDLTAYGIQQSSNSIVTYPVGTVIPGTSCDPSVNFNGLYLVDKDKVNYVGTVRPPAIVSECSGSGN